MGISSSNSITPEDLEKAVLVLNNLESILIRINDALKHKEQMILEKEALRDRSIEQGLSNAIIILPKSLASTSCFSNALSLFPDTKKPTLLQKSDPSESKKTCSKIIQLVSSRLKERDRRPTLIVNLHSTGLLPIVEKQNTIIIGKRFYQDYMRAIDQLVTKMRKHDFQVNEDTGLFGGGPLTYELSALFKKITVVEITLSRMIVENETSMRRFLGALSQ